jgi:hypothetical protein
MDPKVGDGGTYIVDSDRYMFQVTHVARYGQGKRLDQIKSIKVYTYSRDWDLQNHLQNHDAKCTECDLLTKRKNGAFIKKGETMSSSKRIRYVFGNSGY